jgi:hypothetical protein
MAQPGSVAQQVLQDRHGDVVPKEIGPGILGAVAQGRQVGSELESQIPQSSKSRVFSVSATLIELGGAQDIQRSVGLLSDPGVSPGRCSDTWMCKPAVSY